MAKKDITVRLSQVNADRVRMVATYSEDGQAVATRSRTIRIPDSRSLDFDLTVTMTKLVQESMWFWANQMTIPGL